ncbi:MAG: hypothetical protein ACRCR1_11655 [Aeromonas sp.]
MTKSTIEQKTLVTRNSQQYKQQDSDLAERVGISKATAQSGFKEVQHYALCTRSGIPLAW